MNHGLPLPSTVDLEQNKDLEASAARALDMRDPGRIAIILQADDPVIFASSAGEMHRTLGIVSSWCRLYKTEFHTDGKGVLQVVAHDQVRQVVHSQVKLHFRGAPDKAPAELPWVQQHKWLGLLWRADGNWLPFARQRIGAASSLVATLTGFIIHARLPLALGLAAFDIKVESMLRFGRWLWGIWPECLEVLDRAYKRWSRSLLGA